MKKQEDQNLFGWSLTSLFQEKKMALERIQFTFQSNQPSDKALGEGQVAPLPHSCWDWGHCSSLPSGCLPLIPPSLIHGLYPDSTLHICAPSRCPFPFVFRAPTPVFQLEPERGVIPAHLPHQRVGTALAGTTPVWFTTPCGSWT